MIRNRLSLFTAIIFVLFAISQFLWGEVTPIREGFGYDGSQFAEIVANFETLVFDKGSVFYYTQGIGDYQVSRILPMAVVHYGMKLFSVDFSPANIINAFRIYNLCLLVSLIFLMGSVFKKFKFSFNTQLAGFLLLLLNFAVARTNFYLPVFSDTSGLFAGTLLLWLYLNGYTAAILVFAFIGSFIWPTHFYFSAILAFFPFEKQYSKENTNKLFPLLSVLGVMIFVALSAWFTFYLKQYPNPFDGEQAIGWMVPFNVALCLGYLYFCLMPVFRQGNMFSFKNYLKKDIVLKAIVAVIIFVAIKYIISIAQGYISGRTMRDYIRDSVIRSYIDPLVFLTSHLVYFGSLVFLLIIFYRRFASEINKAGLGIQLIFILTLIMCINSESRQMINMIPFFIFFLLKSLGDNFWRKKELVFLFAASFILSRIWFPLNSGGSMNPEPLIFPLQNSSMLFGPWMQHNMYYLQTAFCLVILFVFYMVYRRSWVGEKVADQV